MDVRFRRGVLLGSLIFTSACSDELGPLVPGPQSFVVTALSRVTDDSTGHAFTCFVTGQPLLEYPLPNSISAFAATQYQRLLQAGDSSQVRVLQSRQEVKVQLLANDSVRVVLAPPPFGDTLWGARTGDDIYQGAWSCTPDFPFANDADLVFLGQDSTRTFEGDWIIQPVRSVPD